MVNLKTIEFECRKSGWRKRVKREKGDRRVQVVDKTTTGLRASRPLVYTLVLLLVNAFKIVVSQRFSTEHRR